ncbi:C40 family peptidase [Paenibacillus sp. GCM10012307]|uniref:C40 family peptidase n=1 Tax=Paenibacillus roseus TaxID=2798579 RepID=A0A934J3R0_9BACL|nr:SH3 domain-containing C40 family peptidase [Paenibacillus roseus]MBJ6360276.1 C40 family peptidase [Paenibacillus roseus]
MKKIWSVAIAVAIASATIPLTANAAVGQAQIQSSVSFRTSPNTTSQVKYYLKSGEQVQVLEQVNAYWYKVKDRQGETGYVSSNAKYISLVSEPPASGGSSPQQPKQSEQAKKAPVRSYEQAISAGMKYLGASYKFGADRNSTKEFDCSSFVRRAFLDGMDLQLPADSRQQGDYVKKIGKTSKSWSNLKRGDLMFFMDYKGTSKASYNGVNKSKAKITHVGIYLGNGQVLHTYSKASGGVRIDSIQGKHWEYRFLFGGSVS